jgi:biotin synthase-related radical SAM superfamily protein
VFLKPRLTDLQVRGKAKADEHEVELDSDEETQGKPNAFCPSVDTYRHVLDSLAKALKRYVCRLIVGVGTTDTYALRSLQR